MSTRSRVTEWRGWVLVGAALAAFAGLPLLPPLPQDPAYHDFAGARVWTVASNLPFVLVGLYGLWRAPRDAAYRVLCAGVLLVGFGSAYYHAAPTDQTLLWDRLPMTVAFAAVLALLFGVRVTPGRTGAWLWPLLATSVAAALYWAWTDDLRPYAAVQALTVALVLLVAVLYPARDGSDRLLLAAVALYAAAKVGELRDAEVLAVTGVLSGHALKHLLAAAAAFCLVRAFRRHAARIDPA